MSYFINNLKQKIAYKFIKGKSPGIIFIHGYASDMEGEKALKIKEFAKKKGLSFLRFDCYGHGKSDGKIEDFTISKGKKDLINLIDNVTKGPQILIGSSMGGWLMMLAAKSRKSRIIGLIGIATAVDFDKDLYSMLTLKSKKELTKKGLTKLRKWNFTYILTKQFFSDAKKNNRILNKKFIFNKPFILLHGLKDNVVNQNLPKKILNIVSGNKVQLRFLNNSDHRMSSNNDIKIILNSIENVIDLSKQT